MKLFLTLHSHTNQAHEFSRKVSDAKALHDKCDANCEAPDNCGHNFIMKDGKKIFCKHYYQGLTTQLLEDENGNKEGEESYLCYAYEYPTTTKDHEKMMLWCNTKTMKKGEFETGTIATKGKGSNILMYNFADHCSIFSKNKDGWTSRLWDMKKQLDMAEKEKEKNAMNQTSMNTIGDLCSTSKKNKKWGEDFGATPVFKEYYKKIRKVCQQNDIPVPATYVFLKLNDETTSRFKNDDLEEEIKKAFSQKYYSQDINIHFFNEKRDDPNNFKYELDTLTKNDYIKKDKLQDKTTYYVKLITQQKAYFFIKYNNELKYFKFLTDGIRT
jgi:hypothetical protein